MSKSTRKGKLSTGPYRFQYQRRSSICSLAELQMQVQVHVRVHGDVVIGVLQLELELIFDWVRGERKGCSSRTRCAPVVLHLFGYCKKKIVRLTVFTLTVRRRRLCGDRVVRVAATAAPLASIVRKHWHHVKTYQSSI